MSDVLLVDPEHRLHEPNHSVGEYATEKVSVAPSLFTPSTAGFSLVAPTAYKLHQTLRHIIAGGRSSSNCGELAELSGLSDRTVLTALTELEALGWLRANRSRGHGVVFQLLIPPASLSDTARDYYLSKIEKARERLDAKEQQVRDQEIDE